jgi:hypothetical protein
LTISEQSNYRWHKEQDGPQASEAKKLKDLERESARVKKLITEQALGKAIVEEPLERKYQGPDDDAKRFAACGKHRVSLNVEPARKWDSRDQPDRHARV